MKYFKIAFLFFFLIFSVSAFAQSPDDLRREKEKLNQQLEDLNREYQETLNNKKATMKELTVIKQKIALREQKINIINTQVRNLDNQISESNSTVQNLQIQLKQLKNEYAAMILFTYHNQSAYNKLMFIFAAKDFNQSYKRLKYLQQIGTYRERQAASITEAQSELHVKINELDKDKKQKSNLLNDQKKEKETLGKERNDQVKVVAVLSKHEGLLKQQQKEVQRKIAKTNKAINLAIRREIEDARRKAEAAQKAEAKLEAANAKNEKETPAPAKKQITKSSTVSEVLNSTPEAAKLSNDFLENRGSLPWPVKDGLLVQGFGPFTDSEGIRNESFGYDIRTGEGASVRAVFQGEVTHVSDISGTYLVIIKHGEYHTAYSNLKSVSVKVGQKVSTKELIGSVATDQSIGQAIVSFSIYKGDTPVNPKIWLASN